MSSGYSSNERVRHGFDDPVVEGARDLSHAYADPQLAELAARYEQELAQKEELINALVHELEQAAERLDRFQRTGAEQVPESRPAQSLSLGLRPPEPQDGGLDDLHRMAEEWDQLQAANLLARIESQLDAVHQLVSNLRPGEYEESAQYSPPHEEERVPERRPEPVEEPRRRTDVTIQESGNSWEALKKQILGGEYVEPQALMHTTIPSSMPSQTSTPSVSVTSPPQSVHPLPSEAEKKEDTDLLKLISQTPPPGHVDFGVAGIEELKAAITERDGYIVQLTRLFRMKHEFTLPSDWAALANVPAEMQVRVAALMERLDVLVRLGEVEMSLERARVARERSQIQQEREQMEKHLRRLGLKSIADLDNISASTGSVTDRRWMRFLGGNSK